MSEEASRVVGPAADRTQASGRQIGIPPPQAQGTRSPVPLASAILADPVTALPLGDVAETANVPARAQNADKAADRGRALVPPLPAAVTATKRAKARSAENAQTQVGKAGAITISDLANGTSLPEMPASKALPVAALLQQERSPCVVAGILPPDSNQRGKEAREATHSVDVRVPFIDAEASVTKTHSIVDQIANSSSLLPGLDSGRTSASEPTVDALKPAMQGHRSTDQGKSAAELPQVPHTPVSPASREAAAPPAFIPAVPAASLSEAHVPTMPGIVDRAIRKMTQSRPFAVDAATRNPVHASSTLQAVEGASHAPTQFLGGHLPFPPETGSIGATSQSRDLSAPQVTGRELFRSLDEPSSMLPPGAWMRAGSRHAEGGYLDPSLGWIGVRANATDAHVHAALVASSGSATEVLGGQLGDLHAFLRERHLEVATVNLASEAAPFSSSAGAGNQPGHQSAPDPHRLFRDEIPATDLKNSKIAASPAGDSLSAAGERLVSVIA